VIEQVLVLVDATGEFLESEPTYKVMEQTELVQQARESLSSIQEELFQTQQHLKETQGQLDSAHQRKRFCSRNCNLLHEVITLRRAKPSENC